MRCNHVQTGANDLQTAADRLVQQSICASLSRSFPKVTIIGEEVRCHSWCFPFTGGHNRLRKQKSCCVSLKSSGMLGPVRLSTALQHDLTWWIHRVEQSIIYLNFPLY